MKKTRRRLLDGQNKSYDAKPPLPDTTKWQPRRSAAESLGSAFLHQCMASEQLIRLRAELEKRTNIDHFDSGAGIEDIVREEFTKLCPTRYHIDSGVINDKEGKTAGDFDVIVFNEFWFPKVKFGATKTSRRVHFPIEGIYAVGEIKQTLDFDSLDKAMEKLVACHRLSRPKTFARRLVENRESGHCMHGLSNPLYSFILATDLRQGIELDRIAERFFTINKKLKRLEIIRALCVLGHGTMVWGFKEEQNLQLKPALFMMDDLYTPIVPLYVKNSDKTSALHFLIENLHLHLFHSVLAAEDIAPSYSGGYNIVNIPSSSDISIEPDQEWLELLGKPCDEHQNQR